MQEYVRFLFSCAPEEMEILSAALFSLDCAGITETALGAYEAFFAHEELTIAAVREFLHERVVRYSAEPVENRDWNAEWKKSFAPFYFTIETVVRPGWTPNTLSCKREIIIEPKMTFGTGTHESTQICGALLERHAHGARSLLDIGTGTGILPILAHKLGMRDITAFDTDPLSADNAPENFQLNHCADIKLFIGDIDALRAGFFADLVSINIIFSVTAPLLPLLKTMATQGIIFSGILAEERETFVALLEKQGMKLKEEITLHEWFGGIAVHA